MTTEVLDPPGEIEVGFEPSKYQEAIFDFARNGEGDAFVDACAGSGKTSTLCMLADRLTPSERQNAAFVAFNRHIVSELKERLPGDFTVRTIHSLGYAALRKKHKWSGDPVDDKKYKRIARDYVRDLLLERPDAEFTESELVDNMVRLCSLMRLTLTPAFAGTPHFFLLCDRFGIEVLDEQAMTEGVQHMIREGDRQADKRIDMDDMVYLAATDPELRPWKYDVLLADEAQDFNAAQRTFLLRLRGGRAYWVADERQAIYGFAGADLESVRKIVGVTGATKLPLSICYRCPTSHIRLAQQLVPHIEARPGAPEGILTHLDREGTVKAIRDRANSGRGPLLLCRTTQPLVDFCFELIRNGIPATVKGRDIGKQLTSIIANITRLKGYEWEYFGKFLNEWAEKRFKLLSRRDQDSQIQSLQDKVSTIHLIHENSVTEGIMDADELIEYTNGLFRDGEDRYMPTLSTVHKAKGLEADDVYILRGDLMPHPMAKRPHEIEQEQNVKYIALTRAKKSLTFVEE